MKKIFFFLFPFLFVFLVYIFFPFTKEKQKKETKIIKEIKKEQKVFQNQQRQEEKKEIIIIVGGDIMLDRGVKKVIKKYGNKDYNFPFQFIKKYLKSADIVFANLEGSLSEHGHDLGNKYSFHFEPEAAKALANSGIDIVSLANNHILDWGRTALCETPKELEKVGIKSVGAGCNNEEAEKSVIFNVRGTKIAFLAYTEFLQPWGIANKKYAGVSRYEISHILKKVKELKGKVDLVFVSLHWGDEYKDHAPRRIIKKAHELIDGGVDLIIGHHPHVDQEIERYKNGWIIYSLGNFVFDQSWSKNTMEGLLAEIHVQDKKIVDIKPRFIDLNEYYQPLLRKENIVFEKSSKKIIVGLVSN